MSATLQDELKYVASYVIAKNLYKKGIIDLAAFEKLNYANSFVTGAEPINDEISHIRQNLDNSVE